MIEQGGGASALHGAIESHLDTEFFDYGSYRRMRGWSYHINDFGIFVAKQQHLTPAANCTHVYREQFCPHSKVIIKFKDLDVLGQPAVSVTTCGSDMSIHRTQACRGADRQVHGCLRCNRNFRIDVRRDPSGNTSTVVILTWYYLGLGRSPEDIAARQKDPTYHASIVEEKLIPGGEVAKFSMLFGEYV